MTGAAAASPGGEATGGPRASYDSSASFCFT